MTDTTHENHSSDETSTEHGGRAKPSYDDVNMPVVIMVGVISMVLTFVTIWFVEGIYYQWNNSVIRQTQYNVNTIQSERINAQKASLMEGDAEKGIAGFDSVKNEVVARYQNKTSEEQKPDDHNDEEQAGDEGH